MVTDDVDNVFCFTITEICYMVVRLFHDLAQILAILFVLSFFAASMCLSHGTEQMWMYLSARLRG